MFEGCFVAIATPMFEDGRVDKESMEALIEYLIDAKVAGIVPCGTTGESATLGFEEHKELLSFTVNVVRGRVKVIAGAGSNSTQEAISLTEHAKKIGADAALSITPYYNKPTQRGLYEHFRRIAESVDIPIIIYNVPSRTGVNIEPETVAELSKIKNIVGIKEAKGDLRQLSKIVQLCPPHFSVLSGDDFTILPSLSVGAKGTVSASANVCAKDIVHLIEAHKRGDVEEAKRVHERIFPVFEAMFCETNPAPVKEALFQMGLIKTPFVRPPLVTLTEKNKEYVKNVLRAYGAIKEGGW